MLGQPTIDVTIHLTTEGGTQVFNVTIPEGLDLLCELTPIARITIPGGACPADSEPIPCDETEALSNIRGLVERASGS